MVTTVDISDQIACVKRELSLRKGFYPTLIARGKMTPATAEQEIARMTAVLNTLVLAERAHLDKSWNQPELLPSWQTYPEHKPTEEDIYTEFLVAYNNPRYIHKEGISQNIPKYMFEVSQWMGNGFLPDFKNQITHFMPLPKAPEE